MYLSASNSNYQTQNGRKILVIHKKTPNVYSTVYMLHNYIPTENSPVSQLTIYFPSLSFQLNTKEPSSPPSKPQLETAKQKISAFEISQKHN